MTVEILIPNFNGREALELCVESIAAYTPESHRVIVYDDASDFQENEYLWKAERKGHVNAVISCAVHKGHGYALNALIAEVGPDVRYAVILDNDVQVLRSGWLSDLLIRAKDPRVLIACDSKDTFGYCSRGYRPGMFLLWFGVLNMQAYRDGMAVDWARAEANRGEEPWLSACASLYPPEQNETFRHLLKTQWEYSVDFDRDKIIFDPGATLWAKMRYENPKGYLHQHLTPSIRQSFRHWGHAQSWLEPEQEGTDKGREMRAEIRAELERLRCRN